MTINATMKNEQADGISDGSPGQRAKFSERFEGKGASRNLSSLFHDDNPLNSPEASFTETKDRFLKELYTVGIVNGEDYHPDFPGGYSAENYRYAEGQKIHDADELTAADKPSKKGPNLKVPEIGPDGQPSVQDNHSRVEPAEGGQLGNKKGFGTSFTRNQPGSYNQPALGSSYIERKESSDGEVAPRLGEYININRYLTDPSE